MNHSELPWAFEKLNCKDDRGMGYLEDAHGNDLASLGDSALWSEENEANAAFIVKAVNNHYQLLEAAKLAVDSWGDFVPKPQTKAFKALHQLREAIKQAEAE